ncbi:MULTISPECIES: hypothetical protein [Clostridium]|uniref:hypothetical protein n=1 Tax=Clostridium TaxID=1485 RepID=UPI0007734524|nr:MULTISPECIES: hypothetical protein [Clostridium]AUM95037.1 hypothetical protein RSJ11_07725 [Clostridium sporogenes]AVQ52476.1 hypothetical protein C7M59_06265 [Clostridium botulinum]
MAIAALGIVEVGLDLALGDNMSAAADLLCLFPMGKGIKYIGEIGGDAIKGGSKAKNLYKAEGLLEMNLQKFGKRASKAEFNELNKIYSNIENIRNGNKNLVYDERTLRRMLEDGGPYHNIPNSFDKSIISNEPYVIRADGRVEFLKKGTINGKEGVYHMTIQDNVVKHKLFTPNNDWARFSKRWRLPGYDLID